MLPFDVKLACESVCVTWRQTLRHRPAAGVWDDSILLTDSQQHFGIEGPHSVFLDLALADSQLAERITAVGNWLSQRASGFHSVGLGREFFGLKLDNSRQSRHVANILVYTTEHRTCSSSASYLSRHSILNNNVMNSWQQANCMSTN